MKKNELLKKDGAIIRVLEIKTDRVLIINCLKMTMPKWVYAEDISDYETCVEEALRGMLGIQCEDLESIVPERRQVMYRRYTLIAGILPFIGDEQMRSVLITRMSEENEISKQSLRKYLCQYLAFQEVQALLPKERVFNRELTADEKNMRWSLNRFFYNHSKNSLKTAYKMMLKERYCDADGKLAEDYPSFYQYRYFYRKTRKMQNYYISRNGLTDYQRNNRPCIGDGVQEYAPAPGVGMVDATPCDIYLVNDSGEVVGRPIFTACVDAYSGLCCGYSLSWEGGIYSLRNMMRNVIADKVAHCRKFGIHITEEKWINTGLPGKIVSDQGSEYIGYTFEQLAELGVTVVNLPSYRPELKGVIEKFFDVIQNEFKPHLKGKGVIEPDFQERGGHDYRRDACLTLMDFEKVIIHCIIHYNSQNVLENYPFSDEMIRNGIRPYSNDIFQYGLGLPGANLIAVSDTELVLCLLPRTVGKFSRYGLKVNKLRYRHEGYTEEYLTGKEAIVAYDPDDVSYVWLIDKRGYIRFELVESRFEGKELEEVRGIQENQKKITKLEEYNSLQADIELASHIRTIAEGASGRENGGLKGIRETRRKEEQKTHIGYVKEAGLYDGG